jgi:hypothetical protein
LERGFGVKNVISSGVRRTKGRICISWMFKVLTPNEDNLALRSVR